MKDLSAMKPMEQRDPRLCTARLSDGSRLCGKWAVDGKSVCLKHGAGGGRPLSNPRSIASKAMKDANEREAKASDLGQKVDAFLASGADPLDLNRVAATIHVLANEIAPNRDDGLQQMQVLLQCLDMLRKTAESIERIRASKAWTNAERDWFVLHLSLFIEALPQELQPKALDHLKTLSSSPGTTPTLATRNH